MGILRQIIMTQVTAMNKTILMNIITLHKWKDVVNVD